MDAQGYPLEKKESSINVPQLPESTQEEREMDGAGLIVEGGEQGNTTHEGQGSVRCEPQSGIVDPQSELPVFEKENCDKQSTNQDHQSLDNSEDCLSRNLVQMAAPEIVNQSLLCSAPVITQTIGSTSVNSTPRSTVASSTPGHNVSSSIHGSTVPSCTLENTVVSCTPQSTIANCTPALLTTPAALSTNQVEGISVNVVSERYNPYQVHNKDEQAVVTPTHAIHAATHDINAVGTELSRDVSEPRLKSMPRGGQLNLATGEAPVQGAVAEMSKSLSGMEVVYNSARSTFQAQRMISSMDVLYTAASQLGSVMLNSGPAMDVLYGRTSQQMPSSVPTASLLHNTTEPVLCDLLPSHQSSQGPRPELSSAAGYSIPETSLHSKSQNASYDNRAYEKYKHLSAQLSMPTSSHTRFPLPSSSVLPSTETNASTVSSYYTPQTTLLSSDGDRSAKQIAGFVEHNSLLTYCGTGPSREISGEQRTNSLHPEDTSCQSGKDYGRVSISLPSIHVIPFIEGYDSYRNKVGIDRSQPQMFTEYHHSDGNNCRQEKVPSSSEMGPVQYGYNVSHEKVLSSSLMNIPEGHGRFSYHENGQMGVTHSFDSRKHPHHQMPEFVERDSSQNQHIFYPKMSKNDSSVMYARPDVQKSHSQVYQDLMQGSHVGYFQTGSKTNLESVFPSGHSFGFHQNNHCSGAVELQHTPNEKESLRRLESMEKMTAIQSNRDVNDTNTNVSGKNDDVGDGNSYIDASLSSSKAGRQMITPSSEHGVLYSGPHSLQPTQDTDAATLKEHQLNASSEQYLESSSYAEYALQKDLNPSQPNASVSRSDMSSIKMKINAILESTSLQFDDSLQQKSYVPKDSNRNVDLISERSDSVTDENLNEDTTQDNGKKTVDNITHDLSKSEKENSNESTKMSVSNIKNVRIKNKYNSLAVYSSSSMKHPKKVNKKTFSENGEYGKKRSKKFKDSPNNIGDLSLKFKAKQDSDRKNVIKDESADIKLTSSISLKNEDSILKEDIPQYKCDMCQKEFSHLCSFQRHVRFHSGQTLFTCDLCGQGFNELFSFVDHITEVGSEKLQQLKTISEFVDSEKKPTSLTNSECTKTKRFRKRRFRRSKRLKKNNNVSKDLKDTVVHDDPDTGNLGVEDDSSPMETEDVDDEQVNTADMENTLKTEDDEEIRLKTFKCNECGMQFNYARYLSAHLLTHSDQKSFRCEICAKEFSHGHSLNRHRKKIHPKVLIHSCNICGEGFNRFRELKDHANCHLSDSSLKCKICEEEFACQRDLQVHVSTHTGAKAYQCDLCWKQFTQYCTLLRHKRRFDHSGGPPYKCKWCGEGFYEMGKLLSHSRKHMGSGPHKCDVCGKGFATTNNLKVHKSSVHSLEKPYCCDLCGDQFTRVSYLRQHIKTHTGDRPYVCELCGKGFGMQDTLSKHMRTHTGEKPYSCDQCGKQFSLTATLTVHKRTHTGERPYICDVCGKGFIDNSSWNKHIKHHHKSSSNGEATLAGGETTLVDSNNTNLLRESSLNNYKTFSGMEDAVSGTCLAKNTLNHLVKGSELHLEEQFLTSQISR